MNRLLGQAETALLGRRAAPSPKPRDDGPQYSQPFRPTSSALAEYRDPLPSYYPPASTGPLMPGSMDTVDLTRHVLVCMNEIRELRHELALEREARSTVMTAFAKRIKEEVSGDVRSTEHHLQRSMREIEADILQRITEQDNARALLKRTVDDAVRQVKTYDRGHFDAAEQQRESLDELRANVAQCVGLCHQVRSEVAQKLEREAAAHAHRLDVELVRYADMQRQSQQALADTRRSVGEEVGLVAKTISTLVDECWQRRLATMTKAVDDSMSSIRATHERQEQRVSDVNVKMAQFTKDVRNEIALSTGDAKERIAAMESSLPLLSSRVDRFERKADSVFETANKMTAQTDAMQQTCDVISVQVARSVERCQKLEDGVRERDDRIMKCESQLSGLAGLDRVKVDVEGLRKAITRVEGVMDHVRQIADRDERLVDTLQRNIDGSVERADAVEKKAHKVMARVETAEQRIMGFVDRLIALEEVSERHSSIVDQSKTTVELLSQRVASSEGRQRTTIERVESGFKEVSDRIVGAEGRSDVAADFSSRFEAMSASARKDMERLEKRLGKVENTASNALDNLRETRDVVDIVQREHNATTKKLDQWKETLDRKSGVLDTKLSEFDSTGVSLTDRFARNDKRVAALLEALEKRVEERVDSVAKRLEDVHTASSRRLTQDLTGGIGRGNGSAVVDETLAMEIGASRRRIDGLDARLRQLENQATVRTEDTVQRHEFSGLAFQVKALEGSWRQLQDRIAHQEQRSADNAQRTTMLFPPVAQRGGVQEVVFATPDVSPVQQRGTRPQQHPVQVQAPAPTVASVIVNDDARWRHESPSPTHHQQPSATVAVQNAAETRSSVSSMHGDLTMLADDVSEVTSIGQTTQNEIDRLRGGGGGWTSTQAPMQQQSIAPTGGLPPMSDGTQRQPAPLSAAHHAPAVVVAKKRSPYSDTSESEREAGGVFTSPEKAAPPAVVPMRTVPQSTAPAAHATIADNFDDDEEFEIAADTSATFKLEDSVQHMSPGVMTAALPTLPVQTTNQSSAARPPAGAASPSGGELTTDDDLAAAMFGGRRQSSQRRREFITGDTSASAGELMVPGKGDGAPAALASTLSAAATSATNSQSAPSKKFHAKKSSSATRTSFDDSDEVDDDVEEVGSPREGSQARSKTSSRRSAASRRTTDVSLSLNSSKRHGGARGSRRGADEETIEDIEDDDQLAEMLGFLDKKGGRK
ncbi:Hypothetical protein, putative [Bodo saltans]|uniref:Uncharacterized protein n=1 Tax=Bodo saltans TaxID=75058 RepID=A0A0S4J829_BODSA|nr:Hypothetical protein, putative [Bodo saltans]|eukprot:CUG80171.1 Hypothetical protein, putative [Bodo saltans]